MKSARIRRFWHLYVDRAVVGFATLVSLILLMIAIGFAASDDWTAAAGFLATAATLFTTGLTLFFSAANRPTTTLCTTEAEINDFLCDFISHGSTVHVASFRLSWLRSDVHAKEFLKNHATVAAITVFAELEDYLTTELRESGMATYTYPPGVSEPPHFTLINSGRRGGE